MKMWDSPEGRNENISKCSLSWCRRMAMGMQVKEAQIGVITVILLYHNSRRRVSDSGHEGRRGLWWGYATE